MVQGTPKIPVEVAMNATVGGDFTIAFSAGRLRVFASKAISLREDGRTVAKRKR
jgi:hypothetical protein